MKRLAGTALVAAALLALPLATQSDFVLTILVFAFLQGMLAVSFNLVFGYAGQLSMFHAAAFGIAAYATHLFGKHLGVGYWGGVVLAAALVAAISVVVGAICFRFRLREFYFAVVTLAFSEMARLTVLNWNSMTNGSLGINLQERPIDGTLAWYYVALGALAITLVVCWRLVHSWMGRAFVAIRLNDELGDTLGINVFRYKLVAFTAGSIMAAFAGSLYAYFLGSLEPGLLSIDTSLGIIAMVLLGGRRAVAAPVLGALVLTALPHLIHFSAEIRSLVYGAILIFSILVMPQGIYGAAAQLIRRHA
ncbi:MAG: branched-chain amino acid ABC transporter permease [Betaproteobacteria bacterium]|nr:MAG: branched-chain amino acid ABC transporter permease [Betaproteobacteria bacterium]TMH43341.1 MAG: branched-chain amino acid ABC transporter permease [Betaproteobacteria bacterium]